MSFFDDCKSSDDSVSEGENDDIRIEMQPIEEDKSPDVNDCSSTEPNTKPKDSNDLKKDLGIQLNLFDNNSCQKSEIQEDTDCESYTIEIA